MKEGCFGAAGEDERALPIGYIARHCECVPRLVLVFAVDRQKTFATQPVGFGQVEAHPGLLDRCEDAIEKHDAIAGTIGGEQNPTPDYRLSPHPPTSPVRSPH